MRDQRVPLTQRLRQLRSDAVLNNVITKSKLIESFHSRVMSIDELAISGSTVSKEATNI